MAGWIVAPPKEALEEQSQSPMAWMLALSVSASAFFSAALAETVLAPASVQELIAAFLSYLIAFLLFVSLLHMISRLFAGSSPGWGAWFRAWVIVVLPVHLLLPAALLAQPLGVSGAVIYEVAKLVIFSFVLRRSTWAVQALLRWPPWASTLLVLSPLLIGLFGFLIMMSLLIFVLVAAVLASLT